MCVFPCAVTLASVSINKVSVQFQFTLQSTEDHMTSYLFAREPEACNRTRNELRTSGYV